MSQMTFLELVNGVVEESKVTLDPLTSINFASPPRTSLYGRIKNWVNHAYTELLEDKPDWKFRIERATVPVYPRLYVQASVGYTPVAGDTIEAVSSGVLFTIAAVHPLTEEADVNGFTEYTISVVFDDVEDAPSLIMRESFNKTNPTAFPAAMTFAGWGRYTFSDLVLGLEDVDLDTVRAHYTPADAATYQNNDLSTVIQLPWNKWNRHYDLYPFSNSAFPEFISETPAGNYALYPYPTKLINLSFDYRRAAAKLVLYSDIPSALPARYHEYLMWKAIEELADFDKNATLYSRARKHTTKYEHYMMRDELPKIGIAGWDGVRRNG